MPPEPWTRQPRNLPGAWLAIDELRDRHDEMQIADEVARKVKRELQHSRELRLSAWQRLGAVIVAAVALADFVKGIVH